MGSTFKKGDAVEFRQQRLSGVVVGLAIIDDEVQYLVKYKDFDGIEQERYATEDQLTA